MKKTITLSYILANFKNGIDTVLFSKKGYRYSIVYNGYGLQVLNDINSYSVVIYGPGKFGVDNSCLPRYIMDKLRSISIEYGININR